MALINWNYNCFWLVFMNSVLNFQHCAAEFLPIDWNAVKAENISDEESALKPVIYVPLAPCPCDRTLNYCDISCCCDPACSIDQKLVMHCLLDGQPTHTPVDVCSALPNIIRRHELFLLLCVFDAQTPHLGHFNQPPPIIRDSQTYNQIWAEYSDEDRVTDGFSSSLADLTLVAEYSYGVSVQTLSQEKIGSEYGWLTLPGHSLGSNYACGNQPIKFLVDSDDHCHNFVDVATCTTNPDLSVLYYVIPGPGSGENRERGPTIVSSAGDTIAYINPDNININYYNIKPPQTSTTPSNGDAGTMDSQFWATNMDSIYSEPGFLTNTEPFQLQQTYRAPKPPSIENDHCSNVVVAVRYELFWNGSSIVFITGSIVLDTVPLNTTATQRFKVEWKHIATKDNTIQLKSGNPGYNIGLPLLGAVAKQTAAADFAPTTKLTQVYSLIADTTGWCTSSKRLVATFGEDRISGCFVAFNATAFQNCTKLSALLEEGLSSLVAATHLSKTGVLNLQTPDTLVPILRLVTGMNNDDPFSFFEYSSADNINDTDNQECFNVPHHIGLDIMFSKSGSLNNIQLYEIVGALTYFNHTFWRYKQDDSRTSNKFLLSSSIRFIEKPAEVSKTTKRYELGEKRERCPSAWCWNELFYPFLDTTPGDYLYSLYMGLSTVLLATFIYFVTQPWGV